jgi:hypothetical protein
MFRGMGEKLAVAGFALLAASAFGGTASAADLGGGCCGDLEERVAELEATTARKGNRVVSLEISGQVNQALLAWDDGVDSDAYVVTPTGATYFALEGKISEELKAGYFMQFFVWGEGQFAVNQLTDEGTAAGTSDTITLAHNALYIDHAKLGRVWLGHTSGSTDFIMSINPAQSVAVRSANAQLYNGGFLVRDEDSLIPGGFKGVVYNDIYGGAASNAPGEGHRYDLVKYESPSILGFKVSAAWGEDDFFDAALRYAGLWGGRVKAAAGIGYGTFGDATSADNGCVGGIDADCHQWGASGGLLDVPTGLFVHVAYGIKTDEVIEDAGDDGEYSTFYVQAGIEKNWFGVGPTTIFGEYQTFDAGFQAGAIADTTIDDMSGAEATIWGLGIVQNFASAATDIYLTYRHISSESTVDLTGVTSDNEDFDEVMAGAKIKF